MSRSRSILVPVLVAAVAGCLDPAPDDPALAVTAAAETAAPGVAIVEVARDHVVGDVWHHSLTVALGAGPNARIKIHRIVRERAPWLARPTPTAVMLMHGDFSSFATNFAPSVVDPGSIDGVAVDLAQRGIDVWGVDRRWALAPAEAGVTDFATMGSAQALDDLAIAIGIARGVRLATGGGAGRLHLAGFSRGGVLAYAFAAADGARPAWARQIKGLVALDVWAVPPPEDVDARAFLCEGAPFEHDLVAQGVVDSDNFFQITVGELALSDPDGISPLNPNRTNRGLMLNFVGRTYNVFGPTERYHLAAPVLDGNVVTALAESSEPVIAGWLAHAAPHQALLEVADTDAMQCGDGSGPTIELAQIRVPLLYVGAAGGYGSHGLYSTTQVGSTDVTTRMVQRYDGSRVAEDFGHGDLLFGDDAPALVWEPLAQWLASH